MKMNLVCYACINDQNELESPFLEYLEKYSLSKKDSEKKQLKKVKQIDNIKTHLEYLLENNGAYNLPPTVQKYRGTKIGILKIKESDQLVRIAFFTRRGDSIILLDAMDKPKFYEKAGKLRVDKEIQTFLHRAEVYRLDYLKNTYFNPLYFFEND